MTATMWRVVAVFAVVVMMLALAAALPEARGPVVLVLAFAALYAAAEAAYQGLQCGAERKRADDAEAAADELRDILDGHDADERAPGPLDLN